MTIKNNGVFRHRIEQNGVPPGILAQIEVAIENIWHRGVVDEHGVTRVLREQLLVSQLRIDGLETFADLVHFELGLAA